MTNDTKKHENRNYKLCCCLLLFVSIHLFSFSTLQYYVLISLFFDIQICTFKAIFEVWIILRDDLAQWCLPLVPEIVSISFHLFYFIFTARIVTFMHYGLLVLWCVLSICQHESNLVSLTSLVESLFWVGHCVNIFLYY